MADISIKIADAGDARLHELIAKLDAELLERYPGEGIFGLNFNSPEIAKVTFLMAFDGNRPAGCGALRPLDGETAELKRVYVEKACRGGGIASAIVRALENTALRQGYRKMRLETGPAQPEAIALYKKAGYYGIERYGEYSRCEYSLCFEKVLK